MKHSYLLVGIKAGRFISMITRNKGFSCKHIFKVLFLLNAGIWSGIFSIVEKRKYKNKINSTNKLKPPVFIVGNWRTGTTFLHQLLSVDYQFTTPTVFKVSNPDHFLVSKKYYIPIMSKVLGNKRPMDNVKIGIDEPQEDEYALLKMCKNLPLEKLIFQKGEKFFLDGYNDFVPENEQEFMKALQLLAKKLSVESDKKALFKNPFHSLRIPLLQKNFPEAKFIHIYRDPNDVIPSAMHMWNIVGSQNILKGNWVSPTVISLSELYKKIIISVRQQLKKLGNNQSIEIKFEHLEKNPIDCIENIYQKLDMKFTSEYKNNLINYCNDLNDYKKNKYNVNDNDKKQIKEILFDTIPEYF